MSTLTKQQRAEQRAKALAHLKKLGMGEAYVPLDSKTRPKIEVISSGSIVLDQILGVGGWPKGRIIEVFGPESVGKCLTSDTFIHTENGVLTIEEIFELNNICLKKSTSESEVSFPLINRYGVSEKTSVFTCNGKRETFTIETKSGTIIKSTAKHPHLVMSEQGNWVWKNTDRLSTKDYLLTPRSLPFGKDVIDADMAYMYGLLIADGHLASKNRILIVNDDPDIKDFIQLKMPSLLLIDPKEYPKNNVSGSVQFHFNQKEKCRDFFKESKIDPVLSPYKSLGPKIRSLNKTSLKGVLQGYFDCESWMDPGKYYIEVSSASRKLLEEIKIILMQFNIISYISKLKVPEYPENGYWRLAITGESARTYITQIGTRSKLRQQNLDQMLKLPFDEGSTNVDSIPYCNNLLKDYYDTAETGRFENRLMYDYMGNPPSANLTYNRLNLILENIKGDSLIKERLEEINEAKYFYDPIVSVIKNIDSEFTFDFEMPETHSFIANGIVTHNSTLAIAACIEAQREGGFATYIDFEHAMHLGYAQAMGLDLSSECFAFFQPSHFEEGAQIAYNYATMVQSDLIIIDSVTAMIPQKVFEAGPQDPSKGMGLQARLMSSFLNLISKALSESGTVLFFCNQMRDNIKLSQYDAGPDWTTSGGKALPYYATIRLRLKPGAVEYANLTDKLSGEKEKIPISNFVKAEGYKNKVGFPKRKGEFVIRYGEGIDNARSIIGVAERHKIVRKDGAWYTFKKEGENGYFRRQGVEQFRRYLIDHQEIFQMLMDEVGEKLASFEVSKIEQELSDEDIFVEQRAEVDSDGAITLDTTDDAPFETDDFEKLIIEETKSKPIKTSKGPGLLSLDDVDSILN